MYALARPLLFSLGPHAAHALATFALGALEGSSVLRALVRPDLDRGLRTRRLGLDFPSIVGLAGGFDKNALRPRALAALGFGFLEVGTVTAIAQEENQRPNLFRLPRDRALINRLGFPNDGARIVCERVRKKREGIGVPVAISIGKSRSVPIDPIEPAIDDYVTSLRAAKDACDFVVVNISSPNTKDLRAMQGPATAKLLLERLSREAEGKPILVKIAPDLDDAELEALLAVIEETNIAGVVATNTTIRREGLRTDAGVVRAIGAGGLSGPPLRARAMEMTKRVRDRLGAKVTIVGVGGIETGEDAIAFVRAGADLLQIYTSFVYRGPRAPVVIAREALAIARREGASSIEELVRHG
jgi:dihydroorotate dehydrogenase